MKCHIQLYSFISLMFFCCVVVWCVFVVIAVAETGPGTERDETTEILRIC